MSWSSSGAVRFFIAQAVGIVIEDFVQWIWGLFFDGEKKEGSEKGVETWKKVVGFAWVAVFMLFWTSPAWVFPVTLFNAVNGGKMLPFSVVGHFLR